MTDNLIQLLDGVPFGAATDVQQPVSPVKNIAVIVIAAGALYLMHRRRRSMPVGTLADCNCGSKLKRKRRS